MAQIETVKDLQPTKCGLKTTWKSSKNYCKTSWNEPLGLEQGIATGPRSSWENPLGFGPHQTANSQGGSLWWSDCIFFTWWPKMPTCNASKTLCLVWCCLFRWEAGWCTFVPFSPEGCFFFFNFFESEIGLLWCSGYGITEGTQKMGCKYGHTNFQKLGHNVKVL